jgi:hypothetical protein
VEWFDKQGNIIKTRLWKDGKLIEETNPKPQPDPQLIDSMAMRYTHDFGFLDEKHKESIRTTMKQLWEEVVGLGFYDGLNEWDVEIEMDPYYDGEFIDDGKTHIIEPKWKPRLDPNDCLILKRI